MVFALIAVAHGTFVLAYGVRSGKDTVFYEALADRLITNGFNYAVAFAGAEQSYPPLMYSAFVTLYAGLKLVAGEGWKTWLVALNIAAQAGIGVLLFRLAARVTGSALPSWAAVALVVISFPQAEWTAFALSDTTAMFLSFAVFALAAERILAGKGSWVPVFALAFVAALYRPTGVILPPLALVAYGLAHIAPGARRRNWGIVLTAIAATGVIFLAWIAQDPARWPIESLSGAVQAMANGNAEGWVVRSRPETYHPPPRSLLDHLSITADSFVHFFAVWASDFSPVHRLLNALFLMPVYCLALVAAAALLRRQGRQRDVLLAALIFIGVTALFHAVQDIDYDWRYRLPVLPHLILLAAGGLAFVMRCFAAQRDQQGALNQQVDGDRGGDGRDQADED